MSKQYYKILKTSINFYKENFNFDLNVTTDETLIIFSF